MSDFQKTAQRLLNLVSYRLHPPERRRELGASLVQPNENSNINNDLTDYVWLLDTIDSEARVKGVEIESKQAEQAGKEYDYNYRIKIRGVPADAGDS